MNTGIGDAVNLGWKIAHVLQNRANTSLLDTYEPERIKFARRLVATTDQAFQAASSQGRLAEVMRTQVVPRIAARVRKRQLDRRARALHASMRTMPSGSPPSSSRGIWSFGTPRASSASTVP